MKKKEKKPKEKKVSNERAFALAYEALCLKHNLMIAVTPIYVQTTSGAWVTKNKVEIVKKQV